MTDYVMEAHENYPADIAARMVGSVPYGVASTQVYFSMGVDRVRREFVYSMCLRETSTTAQANPYAYELRDGMGAVITNGGTFNPRYYLNFYILRKDIDTGVVTSYFAHDPDNIVPTPVFGVANIRRTTNTSYNFIQGPKLIDPLTGDVWSHHASTGTPCNINVFRTADDYTQQIYPLRPTVTGYAHTEIMGLGPDWFLCWQSDLSYLNTEVGYISLSPRLTTADETAAGYKNIYAEFAMPIGAAWGVGSFWPRWTMAADGGAYVFGFEWQAAAPHFRYRLYRFELPSSAPYGGPVVGGGITEITPWGAADGPNWVANAYTIPGQTTDAGYQNFIWRDETNDILICATSQSWAYSSPAFTYTSSGMDVTYVNMTTLATETHQRFVGAYMTSEWVKTADPAAAAWCLNQVWEIDMDLPLHTADFAGVDYATRWFAFVCNPVTAGVVDIDGADRQVILARYRFTWGSAPVLIEWHADTSWGAEYPTYAAAVGANIVYKSMAARQNGVPAESLFWDSANSAFWGSGGNYDPTNFYVFDATFADRQAFNGDVTTPLMRLTAETTPPPGTASHGATVSMTYTRLPRD